ncbi:MAG: hypothetical protein DI536_08390 [Archangium gephyra]|uniref:Uncharacterized protein n=1 Tax=Archangium gephyra TaxID=48 RepID=A0A2W5V236_9BACT|nr:MAG: hypothetical protein DI536_08390 [Archangium gephyra]
MKPALLLFAALLVSCGTLRPRPSGSAEWKAVFNDCDDGDQYACFWVASTELDDDLPSAVARFTRACDAGVGEACMELAELAEAGRGMEKDLSKHVQWLERACDLGSARGCSNLGVAWFKGIGVERTPAKSTPLYERACKLGDALACSNFATALNDGRSGFKDVPRARALWRQHCPAEPLACLLLSQELEKDGDQAAATAVVREGCRAGDRRSCLFVCEDLKKSNPAESMRYARYACERGDVDACEDVLELGRGNKALWPELLSIARDACADGNAFACREVPDLELRLGAPWSASYDAQYEKWCSPKDVWACELRCHNNGGKDKTTPACVTSCKAGSKVDCASTE